MASKQTSYTDCVVSICYVCVWGGGSSGLYIPESSNASEMREHFSSRNKLHYHVQVRVIL